MILPDVGRLGVAVGAGDDVMVGAGVEVAVAVGVGVAVSHVQELLDVQDGFLQEPTKHTIEEGQSESVLQLLLHCGTGVGVGVLVGVAVGVLVDTVTVKDRLHAADGVAAAGLLSGTFGATGVCLS